MDLLAELAKRRVMAIVRADSAECLPDVVQSLVSGGIALVELPMTTPGVLEALVASAVVPGALLGAGTVLTAAQATDAVAAGARYLVTPAVVPEVLVAAGVLGVPVVCGAFTATEVVTAARGGAAAVKIFPASAGGPTYVTALRQPLPDIPLVAVGGVALADAAGYLAAGAVAVGIGSPLIGDACRGGSLGALEERTRTLVESLR